MMAIVRISETSDMLPPDGRSLEGYWHEQVHFGDGNERIPLVVIRRGNLTPQELKNLKGLAR